MPGLSRGVLVCLLSIAVGCSATDGLVYGLDASGHIDAGRAADGAPVDRAPTGDVAPLVPLDRPMAADAGGDDGAATGGDATAIDASPIEGDAGAEADGAVGAADASRPDGSVAAPCGSREVCNNNLDDDCNGAIDNGVARGCYTGPAGTRMVGRCRDGIQACSTGAWGACTGQTFPAVETCNNIDDDCDGMVDDGIAESCYTGPAGTSGVGICRNGSRTCSGGVFGVVCPGEQVPLVEVCNGLDDDCDGMTDEGLGTTTCGAGLCARTVSNCVGGVPQVCVPGGSGTETCNNLDDDCDGTVDEGLTLACYTGPAGTNGVGVCRGGTSTCSAGAWGSCAGQVVPTAERCNGLNDDCDTQTDEDFPTLGNACSVGAGACVRMGTVVCRADGLGTQCSAAAGVPGTEVCNNIDDDCDGVVDEGLTQGCYGGPPGSAGVGLCRAGTQTCAAGAWGMCTGEIRPSAEICNNLDDDCNGLIDNGVARSCYTGPAGTSGVGVCRPGSQACSAGAWGVCTGQTLPGMETCNGLDDDCDGQADDGIVNTCATASDLGIVALGGSVTQTTFMPGGTGEQWYRITFPPNYDYNQHGVGTPTINLTGAEVSSGLLRMQVLTSGTASANCSAAASCGMDLQSWQFTDNISTGGGTPTGAFSTRNVPWPQTVLVRVYRPGGVGIGCGLYTLSVSRCTCGMPGCTAPAGSFPAEACDGIDNDCNGLIDEGFCRIGGVCFNNGDLNPANNCQVCRVPSSTVPGPSTWSNVAAGTLCRASAGVCDVAETCNGTGAACPANTFRPSSTVCRASAGVCDATESCTGSSAACPGDSPLTAGSACNPPFNGACSGFTCGCPAGQASCSGTCLPTGGPCTVGVGACQRMGTVICGTGPSSTCSVMPGAPTPEVCDGLDNDCNGLVDEGFCRIGGVCFSNGTLNPANNCQVCTVPSSTVSGPTSWSNVAAGTVCRASAGICDTAETCNGTGAACPADAFVPSTTVCRASAGVCDTAETCTGSSAACPADTFRPSTTVCRASAGVCDTAESCTGSSAACPADTFVSSGAVCRPAVAGGCDVAESCTGSSAACPADVVGVAGTVCRASAGICDTAEVCTGSGNACPPDGFLPSTTVCRASAGVCDTAETCTGSSAACPADTFRPSTTVCRASAGVCDTAESCTGSSAACPADVFVPSTTVCRASAGVCDAAESCTGTSALCPTNSFLPSSSVCRVAAGVCDVAETCTGSSAACPGDAFTTAGTVCRASAGVCDTQEVCTGSGATCPGDARTAAGTVCRASAGICDPQETCDGTNVACPNNTLTGAGTVCRASAGICDPQEVCTGSSATCPNQVFTTGGTVCRATAGICDPQEVCTGSSATCPGNTLTGAGTICRATAGICDPAETCTGSSATCPNQVFTAGGTVCRSSAGICDVQEVCTGGMATCPGNSFQPSSTVCRASVNQPYCDPIEYCTGGAAACPGNSVIRTPVAETCNSVDDNCDGTVDEGSSNACGSAYNLGTVNVGGTVTRTEWIPSTSGAEQWYVVNFPMNPDYAQHGTGTPQIRLTAGASVRFDVRSNCSTNLACGTGGTASGLTTWSFTDSVSSGLGGFTTRNVAWPTTVYIRVYRVSAPTTCANQTLVISRPNGVGFQSVFAQGVVPNGTPACTDWNAYRAGLDASAYYESVTLSGSNDPTGRTCTGAAANTICQALRAGGATVSVSCGGVTWSVGQCGAGNIEVTAGGPFCSCGATYAARPCHGDSNFGGINGSTCGAATQQIAVNCVPARTNYQGAFTTGVTPNPTAACTTWNSYRSTLSASLNYQTVRLSARSTAAPNTANTTGRGCTGAAANQICQALRSGTTTSVACNGHTWTVGQCGTNNWEVNADGLFCNCGSSFAARPCHGDPNFGGVGIGVGSCGAQSQNIQVDCQPTLTYSQSFRQGETPSGTWQCSEWNGFRASINAGFSYSSITLSGSNDPRGRTCTGAAANTLCQAIRTGASTSVSCDGQTWSVGNCGGGIEVTAGGPFCSCGATYAARPCHPNPDFGGINGSTCGAAAQTLTVNCQ